MKNILNDVKSKLKTEKDGYCLINHKKGWLGFLGDGDLVFTPHELHQVLRQVIDSDGMRPRGDKLFYLRKRTNFTVTSDKKPYRPEEALERFISSSNPGQKISNQIPIGGGKESVDLGIEENDSRFVFIELKPWSSTNSPLYAIVESLKNLIEYRIIHEKEIRHYKDCKHYNEVDLIVLAPESYYRSYGLVGSTADKIRVVKKALNDLSAEFDTNISLMVLPLKEDDFFNVCQKVCSKNKKTTGQEIISISRADSIPDLARDKWKVLVSADKILH